MKGRALGFTIVELLIVIVVVAILAAITVVAYNGIQTRAETSAKQQEALAWVKAFRAYRSAEGSWPSNMAQDTSYCLGKGFPIGAGGVARCRDIGSTSTGYPESDNTPIMNQLRAYVQIGDSPKKAYGGTVGPYARIIADGTQTIEITQIFSPAVQCPSGLTQQFKNSSILWCEIKIIP